MSSFLVRKANLSDLSAVKSLADANKNELGFVLRPALAKSIENSEILLAENSTGVIAFVEYHHRLDQQMTLYHIAVESGYRKQGVGRLLIGSLVKDARCHGKAIIQLKCPADLPANGFYSRLGFTKIATQNGRFRPLITWRLSLEGDR
jgi:ribosomal protein S18 acetylase RimI-like enzyme